LRTQSSVRDLGDSGFWSFCPGDPPGRCELEAGGFEPVAADVLEDRGAKEDDAKSKANSSETSCSRLLLAPAAGAGCPHPGWPFIKTRGREQLEGSNERPKLDLSFSLRALFSLWPSSAAAPEMGDQVGDKTLYFGLGLRLFFCRGSS